MNMPTPQTLNEAIELVKTKGFYIDFTWDEDCLYCSKEDMHFAPNEFTVEHHFRLPNGATPHADIHLFALASHSLRVQGYMVCDNSSLSFYPFAQRHITAQRL